GPSQQGPPVRSSPGEPGGGVWSFPGPASVSWRRPHPNGGSTPPVRPLVAANLSARHLAGRSNLRTVPVRSGGAMSTRSLSRRAHTLVHQRLLRVSVYTVVAI